MLKKFFLLVAALPLLIACGAVGGSEITVGDVTFRERDLTETDSGLQYLILEEGDGAKPLPGDIVDVHYSGWLRDGTPFDSSRDRGQPFSFPLGAGQVVAGWDEGIALLEEGDRALLIVPPDLGYGSEARGAIPADATLYFDVELVAVRQTPRPTELDEEAYNLTLEGIEYADLEVGDGAEIADGDLLVFDLQAWDENGTLIADSDQTGQPLAFAFGSPDMLQPIQDGIRSMRVGGTRQVILTAEQAGTPTGVVLEMTLREVAEGGPAAPQVVDPADLTETESGLKYYDFVEGTGASPEVGQSVTVHYSGWLEDGTKFDSSYDRATPFEFPLGVGAVIPGWDEGVGSMQVGGVRQLVIPAELGYGDTGSGIIPPGATLIFEVELLDVAAP